MSNNVISKIKLPDGTSYDLKDNGAVRDVQINSTSILSNGIANIPLADLTHAGVAKVHAVFGITTNNGYLTLSPPLDSTVKAGTAQIAPILASNQHLAAFYGLAKAAGADEKNSQLTAGTYSDTAKTAIRTMLGVVGDVQINSTSITSNGVANIPIATSSIAGVVKVDSANGIKIVDGKLKIEPAGGAIKNGALDTYPITPKYQHNAVFYGLAKVAGVDEKDSTLAAGTYTDTAKTAIRTMIGAAASDDMSTKVDKTAIDNAGIINKTYTAKFNGQFSVTTTANQDYISPYVRASVTGRINKHKNHRVTINDQQYILPTRLWYIQEGEDIKVYQYLGNLNLYVSDTTGVPDGTDDVPFIIISDINNSSSIDVLTETAGTYTILVEQIDNTQTALPKSLIWDDSYVPILKNNNGGTYNGFSIGVNELNSTRGTCAIGYGNKINNEFSYSIGISNTINGASGVTIGNLNTATSGFAFGSHLLADKTNMIAVGYQNAASKNHTTWATNTQYNVGDVVYATIGGRSLYLICTTAHTSTNVISDVANWKTNPSNGDTAFVVGNGNPINTSSRSNALKLDWIGNLYLGGNVYVGAGADSTGGTKLAALSDVQVNGTSIINNNVANIPIATSSTAGVVKIPLDTGLYINPQSGEMLVSSASSANIKEGTNLYRPLSPAKQHEATFYGLSKAAGVDMSSSSNEIGTYTDTAKTAIRSMLGAVGTADYASTSAAGVIKMGSQKGLSITDSGELRIRGAYAAEVKAGTHEYFPVTPKLSHYSAFYGLAKAAGADMSSSSNEVGTYTAAAKTAIQTMLGVESGVSFVETVSGTTPTITGQPNVRYVCGECSTLSITPPASGTIDVIFESGTSVTVLTVPSTVKWPAWFDATALETSTTYEILITDGVYGSVMSWAT